MSGKFSGYGRSIIGIILLGVGIFFLVLGIKNSKGISSTLKFNRITFDTITEGDFIEGTASKVLNRVKIDGPNKSYFIYFLKIPENDIKSKHYIGIKLTPDEVKQFEYMLDANNTLTYDFTGKIVKLTDEIPYSELASALGVKDKNKIKDIVSSEYIIDPVDFQNEKDDYIKGVALIIMGILFLLSLTKRR